MPRLAYRENNSKTILSRYGPNCRFSVITAYVEGHGALHSLVWTEDQRLLSVCLIKQTLNPLPRLKQMIFNGRTSSGKEGEDARV